MRALRLVGPGEDGTVLIVEAVDPGSLEGERFTLSLDDRLRTMAAARPDEQPETPGATPAESSGPVPTPREIQVRVRAGETAQAVADEAGIPLERVMRFAYPVLQERVRVTDEARRARARRGGDGLLAPFGELIDSRLARHGVDPASVRWDAYRREDGGWTVTAEFTSHERTVLAKFSFALLNRTVSALDDIAADLLSDRPVQALLPPPPPPAPVVEPVDVAGAPDWDAAPPPPRLTAVPGPGRVEPPRPQEAGAAVRPPSRRQKAHTRPVPAHVEDELFDQDAFEQQPWHEPPLPFETGSAPSSPSPRHRAQRSADDPHSEAVRLGRRGTVEPAPAEAATPEPGVTEAETATATPEPVEPGSPAGFEEPDFVPAEELFKPVSSSPGTATAMPVAADDDQTGGADPETGDTGLVSAVSARAGAGDQQGKRGRRSGEKPRMPSWDDILLGVRHKSD